jgi:hypothetical protein
MGSATSKLAGCSYIVIDQKELTGGNFAVSKTLQASVY